MVSSLSCYLMPEKSEGGDVLKTSLRILNDRIDFLTKMQESNALGGLTSFHPERTSLGRSKAIMDARRNLQNRLNSLQQRLADECQ
jgi:hypothetical protein